MADDQSDPQAEATAPFGGATPPAVQSDDPSQEATAPFSPQMWEAIANPPPSLKASPTTNPQNFFQDPEYRQIRQEGKDLLRQQREFTEKSMADINKSSEELSNIPIPQLEKPPKAPQANLQEGMMEWMSAATVLAGLAGGFARGNATMALNAFHGAVKGFTEGKLQDFETKTEEFKLANERIKEDNQAKLDQYKLIWENKKTTMDQKLNMFKTVAALYQDEITWNLADRRDYNTLAMSMEHQNLAQERIDIAMAKLGPQLDEIKARTEMLKVRASLPVPQQRIFDMKMKSFAIQHGHEPTPDDAQNILNGIVGGVSGGRARGAREGALTAILDTLDVQAPKAIEASNRVDRNLKFRKLDEWDVAIQAAANDEDAIEFLQRNFNIAEGWARSMNPQGVPREDLMNRALSILNGGLSQGTYEHAIDTLVDIVQTERMGLQRKPGEAPAWQNPNKKEKPTKKGVDFKYDEDGNIVGP